MEINKNKRNCGSWVQKKISKKMMRKLMLGN
jgi:hypothetical protein